MRLRARAVLPFMAIFLSVFLSGCNLLSTGDELLKAPQSGGELSEIKAALDSLVSEKYTLKYPQDGEHRSAIIRYDITADGKEEAIALYSTESENITQMHIAVLTEKGGKWTAAKDSGTPASGVERIEFCDLNSDGETEILVGWNIVGNVDKQVSVYSFDGNTLLPRAEEKYTSFLCCDLNTDQKNELLILHINTAEKKGSARLLELTDKGINEKASAPTDGGVSSYLEVKTAKLLDGKTAVFADGKKGNGAVTEIIFLSGETLQNPMYNPETAVTLTERIMSDVSFDINGDSSPDIPMHTPAPGYETAAEGNREYLTKWCAYNGRELVVTLTTVADMQDGYYLEIPKEQQESTTLLTSADGKTKIISLFDKKKGEKTDELYRIKETPKEDWKEEQGWTRAAETERLIISVQRTSDSRTAEKIAQSIKIFGEEQKK